MPDVIAVDAILADSVQVSGDMKLQVQGGAWNSITAAQFPAQHDRIGVGVVIQVPYTATNQSHTLEVSIEDADGGIVPLGSAPEGVSTEDGLIRRIGGPFNIGRPPGLAPGEEQVVPFAINLNGVKFPAPGPYCIAIFIDGNKIKSLPFKLQQVQPPLNTILR
ncbi:MAG: DUF6941 family protein [Acidimicrobiia bacterium]